MAVEFDPTLPSFRADPFPMFIRLREEDPVHWSAILGGWVLTRYAEVKAVLGDASFSADRISPFMANLSAMMRERFRPLGESLGQWVVFTDPPRHTRLRSLQNKAFSPPRIQKLRPRVREIAAELIAPMAARSAMDLIADFAYPLPVTVIAEMVGVPRGDLDRFKVWSDELALFVGSAMGTPGKWDRAQRSLIEMEDYFRGLIAARRAEPRDDILSALIAAEEDGDKLSAEELLTNAIGLVFAGHETTTNLIGNGILTLLKFPEALEELRLHPERIAPAVEELLRYDGPVGAIVRIARRDAEIGGKTVRRGERVFVMLNAANRDPEQFADPDRLDFGRKENAHLTFGYGVHYCLGAPLARLEGQLALEALLSAFPSFRLGGEPLCWRDSLVLRGVERLPIVNSL
ncbi:cytochrome P450 [Candidatus Sumerlaeota bacterium]|nr:cytochrome P450 [Candidatus Sumerlaeota bacterium]